MNLSAETSVNSMAQENDVEGDLGSNIRENAIKTDDHRDSTMSKDKEEPVNQVPFYKLFSFADPVDFLLMLVGTIAAVGNGISLPLMTIIFGDVVNSFGQKSNIQDLTSAVSKVIMSLFLFFNQYQVTVILSC